MLARTAARHTKRLASSQAPAAQTFKAFYAVVRKFQTSSTIQKRDSKKDNDFILSILRATPSSRDAKSYLSAFASPTPVVASILNPVHRRAALVKIQGPFTDRQLDSIAGGMVYLEKLGLLSVIVVENTEVPRGEEGERTLVIGETMRVATALEKAGARARPILGSAVRMGPKPCDQDLPSQEEPEFEVPEAHAYPNDLVGIRSALRAGEIPVLAPLAVDSFMRSVRVDANDVVAALARGMVEAAALDKQKQAAQAESDEPTTVEAGVDLTPLRLMIINREGGVPSYARRGLPHLLVNTTSEYKYIHDTFQPQWRESHPTALANLSLARTCLHYMPANSSAVMVSHRSHASLIGNLITNKPALSSSLPHALLQGNPNSKLTPHTPTLIRRGLPIHVIRTAAEIDRPKMKALLEESFRRTLDEDAFYARLEQRLDFVIVAGDYAGAAIVTNEPAAGGVPIAYLDKFAVLPSHQGDGTVDFLWVALHDESYGLGLSFSANPNGGKGGQGEGRDLVWRSRADNPINRWYFERSTGHHRMGEKWVLFWCDAEVRLKIEEGRRANAGLRYVEDWEQGRLKVWAEAVDQIPSAWK